MYLNLGKVKKKYEAESIDDFMIISEIPNSQLSYEKPILVRTIDELNIWFGKDFEDRDYLEELINNNVTLYLYKPIEDQSCIVKDYINLDNYLEDDGTYANSGSLPLIGDPEYKYWVGYYRDKEPPEGIEKGCWYVYIDDNWYSEKNLPQNIDNQSNSLNNRDTLLITKPDLEPEEDKREKITYCHPEFRIDEPKLGVYSREYELEWGNDILNPTEKTTLALEITYENEELSGGDFLLIQSLKNIYGEERGDIIEGKTYLFSYDGSAPNPEEYPNFGNFYSRIIDKEIKTVEDIKQAYEYLGYKVSDNLIYSSTPFEFKDLYKLSSVNISPSFNDNNNIITEYIDSKDLRGAEFWSRTIGKDEDIYDDESIINLTIEHVEDYTYRITVSRYNYVEVFEGPIRNTELGEERLDFIINKESKLIYCTFVNISDGLRDGTFTLERATIEKQNEDMYWKSLEVMFDLDQDTIFPDYFLVPDKLKYIKQFKNYDIDNKTIIDCESTYKTLLEYATSYNFQVLIENNIYTVEEVKEFPEDYEKYVIYKKTREDENDEEILYKLEGKDVSAVELNNMTIKDSDDNILFIGDFVFNNIDDKENRLVYFYKPIIVNRNLRPGYYLYLYGLLRNIYAIDEKYVLYYSPNYYPYEDNEREELLKEYKCNYLTCNNHSYYYKEYFSGDKPISSAWMRFVVGKVAREFYKHKWDLLKKFEGEIQNNINYILNRVKNSFSLIRYISLDNFSLDLLNNKLKIIVSVYMSDLVSSNMTIDITLNFNNF